MDVPLLITDSSTPRSSSRRSSALGLPAGIDFDSTVSPDRLCVTFLFSFHISDSENVSVEVIDYNSSYFNYFKVNNLDEFLDQPLSDNINVRWISVIGFTEAVLSALGRHYQLQHVSSFSFHHSPLSIEDALHVEQRPKVDIYQHLDYLYVCLNLLDALNSQQVSIFLCNNKILITILQFDPHLFINIRHRLRFSKSKERSEDASFLLYSICDTIIDKAFPVLDLVGSSIEALERRLFLDPSENIAENIRAERNKVLSIKRVLWCTKDVIGTLKDLPEEISFSENTKIYFKDVYDHVLLLANQCDQYRDNLMSIGEQIHQALEYRQNQQTKVLSIVATLFLPLTFLSSVYGMNIPLPFAQSQSSFYLFCLFCIILVAVLMSYFKHRRWF
ncbi:hypothetical protein RCL1_006865 [Eukaryota sp. TZLM3-RCL]